MNRCRSFVTLVALVAGCSTSFESGRAERRGLGTTWGEDRASPIRPVRFVRDDPAQPLGVVALHYDDAPGVGALTAGASWHAPTSGGADLAGGAAWMRLLDGRGIPLPMFTIAGRHHVEGRAGERYAIEICNLGGSRLEAVATVDGLDVMDGKPGSLAKRGYIINPGDTVVIDGFRRSQHEVAAFRFGRVSESYAALTGDDANVGVIGVALFGERGFRWPWFDEEAERRRRADPFPDRFALPPR
jgi:hypothetical protein